MSDQGTGRRFYWYWPFARPEEIDWARATARTGEHVTVHVIDRDIAPASAQDEVVEVVRDLPDVDRRAMGRAQWAASRANTYLARERKRRAAWSSGPFDLVHLHYVNRFTDVWSPLPHPLVLSVHDVVPHVTRLGGRFERLALRRLYHRPDALVVHHQRLADQLTAEFRVPRGSVHVVPHQVFPTGRPPSGRPPSPAMVLFFGALRANKGIELLAPMMAHLGEDLRLVIAGRGDPAVERQALAVATNDPRVVCDIGQVSLERKRELFRAATLVVLPYTEFASQSGVLHDAYGAGRPVVVSDVGALGAAVREDGTGLVVPPNDPRRLARAVEELLEPDRWDEHSASARRVAEERSPEAVGARLREVYDTIL